jgi:hypothetical protein
LDRLCDTQAPRRGLRIAGSSHGWSWALWRLLVDFRYNVDTMSIAWPLEFAIVYLATLTPYRMLMTWTKALSRRSIGARDAAGYDRNSNFGM